MIHGVFKQDKVHGSIQFIVVLQSFNEDFIEAFPVINWQVFGITNTLGKVTVDQRLLVKGSLIKILEK